MPKVSAAPQVPTVKLGHKIPANDRHRLKANAAIQGMTEADLLSELIRTLPEPPAYPAQARKSAPSV